MARALGVSAAAIGAASGAALTKTTVLASKAATGASVGTTATLPWIGVGVVGLALAGAIVGTQAWKKPVRSSRSPAPAAIAAASKPAAAVEPAPAAAAPVAAPEPATPTPALLRPELAATTSGRRARAASLPLDVREQNALIDAAREAVSSGAAHRALALLRRYQDKYPGGIFRPEAAALKIEALARLGRDAEVRVLANRFVAEYGDGPLTERVRHVAGLARP
jgi:TolA-binding protein